MEGLHEVSQRVLLSEGIGRLNHGEVERFVDRPDYHVQVFVDRVDGVILRLVESVAGEVTRDAQVTHCDPDAALPPTTFDFEFPEGTTLLY